MSDFWYFAAPVIGGLLAGFVGGTGVHAFAKRLKWTIDINDSTYGPWMVITVLASAIASGLANYHLYAACGIGASLVSLVLTLPVCVAILIGVLHGPHVIANAASLLADKLLSLIGGKGDKRS